MTTSRSDGPGTSTPCHRDSVPNRHVGSSAANCLTSCMVASSPWHSSGNGSDSRSAAAAALAARIEENSPSVRPPAALISSHSSSRYSAAARPAPAAAGAWPRRGCRCAPCANGDPTSMPAHSRAHRRRRPAPHCLASGANEPPRVSVAEVRITVLVANRRSASTSPTSSGATCSDAGRDGSGQSSGRSSQTTSSRSSIGCSKAADHPVGRRRRSPPGDQRGLRGA